MVDKLEGSDGAPNRGSADREVCSLDRRNVLGGGIAVAGGLLAGQLLPSLGAARTRSTRQNEMLVAAVGELMPVRPFSMHTEPSFTELVRLLREADVTYGHLEMNLADDDELSWAARGSTGAAGYLVAPAALAKEIAWLGIDALSLAMNHSFDWGVEGLLATKRNCEKAGIAVAGTGVNLEEARAPAFFENDKGRIAMVSIASGNSPFEWAGHPKGSSPGRPGVNPLRLKKLFVVPPETAEMLRETGRRLGTLSENAADPKEFNITPGAISGSNGYSGSAFLEGDRFDVTTVAHPGDIAANIRAIEAARAMADFVMVAHHNSVSEKSRGESVPAFQIDFARKAIDAGADIYVGHGWHTALGIEIYKGKPIVYGMGNFFWQSNFIQRKPADQYESYGFDIDRLTSFNPSSGHMHPAGNEHWGYAAVYHFKYVDRRLTEIRLYPIEHGYDFSGGKPVATRLVGRGDRKYLDGSPRMAYGANAQWILRRLQHLCQLRGTRMDILGDVGVIKI